MLKETFHCNLHSVEYVCTILHNIYCVYNCNSVDHKNINLIISGLKIMMLVCFCPILQGRGFKQENAITPLWAFIMGLQDKK